ncbi:MAG: alkaline phosphatase family protein [Myxococcota bacterium]|nr:alkaline phosphatase family protein [Myxococcota bacterium]
MTFLPTRKSPLLILGFDGADFSIIDELVSEGKLPNLQNIMKTGIRSELLSTEPAATLPAWTNFMTGTTPDIHGVTNMFFHHPGAYTLRPATGADRTIPTWLNIASRAGRSVACFGVPGTYPPEAINGIQVSGFDSPGGRCVPQSGIHPKELHPYFENNGGWQFGIINEFDPRRDHQRAIDTLITDLNRKERLISGLLENRHFDIIMAHFQASDTVAHHYWHTHDLKSPRATRSTRANFLSSVYEKLDQLIGRLRSKLPDNHQLLIVSDHGFQGAADHAIHLNRWLHQAGYLHFKGRVRKSADRLLSHAAKAILQRAPHRLRNGTVRNLPPKLWGVAANIARGQSINYATSLAFSDELDFAPSIWLNEAALFSHGTIAPADAAALSLHLKKQLTDLRHPTLGHPLFEKVTLRTDQGLSADKASIPHLTLTPRLSGNYRPSFLPSHGPGPFVEAIDSELWAVKGSGMPGVHRREGIFIYTNPQQKAVLFPQLKIEEAGALIYRLLEVPAPNYVNELPPFLEDLLPFAGSEIPSPLDSDVPYSINKPTPGRSEVAERLRTMGYL